MKWYIPLAFGLLAAACSSQPQDHVHDTPDLKTVGDSIAMLAQGTLLKNVTHAMQEGGPVHAIAFCNTEAGFLTDSVGAAAGYVIQRITDKPRNPGNQLSEEEKALFDKIKTDIAQGTAQPHYLLEDGAVFYKPIVLGMPTCLKCHGSPGVDVEPATLSKLAELYPEDRATGYSLGELRGLWKITAPAN